MLSLQESIQAEVLKIRNKYLESANEIVGCFHGEEQLRKDYEGRQIYELLQNAEDECGGSSDGGEVSISLVDGILSIKNTGNPFSFLGIKSLMYPNSSPKKIHENKIGCKGLGFRSVLNWASEIKIRTKEFCVVFSKEYAKNFYLQIIKEAPHLLEEIKLLTLEEFPIALLSCPQCIDDCLSADDKYSTSIELSCHQDLISRIKGEIEQLSFEELLFLKNLKKIYIRTADQEREIEKLVDGHDVYLNETDSRTRKMTKERLWTVYTKDGEILTVKGKKKFEFAIAYPDEDIGRNNVLYSYFKTDVKMPYPALIHGTFELSSDRNNLQKGEDSNNGLLIDRLIDFMIETSIQMAKDSHKCDYTALRLLVSDDTSYILDEYFGFSKKLKDKLAQAPILPTISGKFVSVMDRPKYSVRQFDRLLNPNLFPNLLKGPNDQYVNKFLEKLLPIDGRFYTRDEFASRINADLSFYKAEDRAELLYLFVQEYKYRAGNKCPNLLIDSHGNNIVDGRRVFLLDAKEETMNLPEWVSISFLHSELLKNLKQRFGAANNRALSDELKWFNVAEYNFSAIYSAIKPQINKADLTINECKEVLQWLFSYYLKNPNTEKGNSLEVKIITRNNELIESNKAYFGMEYNNSIGENVLKAVTDAFIADKSTLGLNQGTDEEIEEFLSWIGVRRFPRLYKIKLDNVEIKKYSEYHLQERGAYYASGESYHSEFVIEDITVNCFENFESILTKAKFEDTIIWLLADNRIQKVQANGGLECFKGSKITGKTYSQRALREVTEYNMSSYILWKLKTIAWIQTGNGYVAALECCFKNHGLNGLIFSPEVDYTYVNQKTRYTRKQIEGLLSFIGIAENFCEMNSKQVYKILFELPNYDVECKLGKRLYEQLSNAENIDKIIQNNENYKAFIRSGKVLAKTPEGRAYCAVKDVYYTDKRLYGSEILKKFNIFDFPARSGVQKAKKLFGVNPLKDINVKVKEPIVCHPANSAFQEMYAQFLPYVYACRIVLKNAEQDYKNLRSMRVLLCNELEFSCYIDEKEYCASLQNYEVLVLKEEKSSYIKVPQDASPESLRKNIEFASAVADIIEQILDVGGDSSFYRDLFIKDIGDRDYTIKRDRGDENLQYLFEAKQCFGSTATQKEEFFIVIAALLGLSYENYSDIKNKLVCDFKCPEEVFLLDYANLKTEENAEKIIKLFNILSIEIDDYNKKALYAIDIRSYWGKKWNQLKKNYQKAYISYLYCLVQNDKIRLTDFKLLKEKYLYGEKIFENSTSVQIEIEFEKEYNVSIEELNKVEIVEWDFLIRETRQNNEINYEEYEEDVETVQIAFALKKQECLRKRNLEKQGGNDSKFDAKRIRKELDCSSYTLEETKIQETETDLRTRRGAGGGNSSRVAESQPQRDESGLQAEYVVYDFLKQRYQETCWVSGYAAMAGVNGEGSDLNHYDIRYCDENGSTIYVEVKAVSGKRNIEFKISQSEMRFGQEHSKNYEIFAVRHQDKKILYLGKIFDLEEGEDVFKNTKFSISSDSFMLSAKIVEEYDE